MRLEELERELRAERPEVDPDFAARLDEWSARGFPRGGELDPRRPRRATRALRLPRRARRTLERARALPPRRIIAPVGAAATLIVIVGVAISQIEPASRDGGTALTAPAEVEAPDDDALRATGQPGRADAPGAGRARGGARPALPEGAARDLRAQGLEGPMSEAPQSARRLDDARPGQRRVAQTISVSLATAPEDFRDSADGVLDVVRDHNGFVLRSSVSSGDPDVGGAELGRASFRLRIPAAQLQPALGALSDLGHLVSRTDGSRDITARFTSARERIEALTESRDRLLRQLEQAVTEAEQESIRRRLRIVESRLDSARDDLARAQQRVRLVPVNVAIAADPAIDDGGGWGVAEALDDAGRVLTVAAGIILISAAVLLPLAVLAAIAWLVASRFRRLQRDRALDA